jgi:hypothetical protein
MNKEKLENLVLLITAVLGGVVAAISLFLFFGAIWLPSETFDSLRDAFDSAISQVLLPMFNTLVTASLAFIFGNQVVPALARRIQRYCSREAPNGPPTDAH